MRGSATTLKAYGTPLGITPPPYLDSSCGILQVRYDIWLPPHRNFLPRRATKLNGEAIISTAKKILCSTSQLPPRASPGDQAGYDADIAKYDVVWNRSCRDRLRMGGPLGAPPLSCGCSQAKQMVGRASAHFRHLCIGIAGVPFGHSIFSMSAYIRHTHEHPHPGGYEDQERGPPQRGYR